MERIRDDKKVLDELKEREMLQKYWQLYEAGIRSNVVKSTIITSEEVHNSLENLTPLEEPYKSAQHYYGYITQMIKILFEGVNSENSFMNSENFFKEISFLEEMEILKKAVEIAERDKKRRELNLTRRKTRENL